MSWGCIVLTQGHCSISDVRMGTYGKICDAPNKVLVGDGDVMIRKLTTGIWKAWGGLNRLCDGGTLAGLQFFTS
jgi:hypothetical protein